MSSFGSKLRQLRSEKGLTQDQLGNMLGETKKTTISGWERDERFPRKEELIKLSEIFCVSLDYLLGGRSENVKTSEAPDNKKTIFSEDFLPYLQFAEVLYEQNFPIEKAMKIIELIKI